MMVKSIVECSPWSILQYLWPALSVNWSWKPIFCLFESGHFTQVLLYCIDYTVRVFSPHYKQSPKYSVSLIYIFIRGFCTYEISVKSHMHVQLSRSSPKFGLSLQLLCVCKQYRLWPDCTKSEVSSVPWLLSIALSNKISCASLFGVVLETVLHVQQPDQYVTIISCNFF